MRLVTYTGTEHSAQPRPGVQAGEQVLDAADVARAAGFDEAAVAGLHTTRDVLALGLDALPRLAAASAQLTGIALADVHLGPPVPDPPKIICLGLNYADHAAESGSSAPTAPMFFAKWANSLVGPTDDVVPPRTTEKVDYEAELAVVIGRRGRNIAAADAVGHVAGAMAFNDVSARDLQKANPLWTGGKAIDTFGPCGPALVTLDELGDLQDLALSAKVNGELVQDGNTASMIFGVADTIEFLSQTMTLEVGDIIATGTPAGVGQSRTPPLFLHAGDVVEIDLAGVGTLRNTITDPH